MDPQCYTAVSHHRIDRSAHVHELTLSRKGCRRRVSAIHAPTLAPNSCGAKCRKTLACCRPCDRICHPGPCEQYPHGCEPGTCVSTTYARSSRSSTDHVSFSVPESTVVASTNRNPYAPRPSSRVIRARTRISAPANSESPPEPTRLRWRRLACCCWFPG